MVDPLSTVHWSVVVLGWAAALPAHEAAMVHSENGDDVCSAREKTYTGSQKQGRAARVPVSTQPT
jgi:hypothetical protein